MDSRFDEPTLRWFDDLTEQGRVVVFVRDENHQTTYLSDNVEQVTGWTPDAFARRFYSLAHPDDQTALFDASRTLRASEAERGEVPLRVLLPGGGFRWFLCRLDDRLDDPRVGGIVVRIDPLGSAVSTLERHFSLLSTTTDVIVVFNDELLTEYVSPSVEHVLGYLPDEVVRRWREILPADDLEALDRARRAVMGTPGAEVQLRVRANTAEGSRRTFDVVVANRLRDESINGILVSARDVTELVETEERLGRTEKQFEVLVETSPDVFLLLDPSSTVLFVSAGIESILGREAADVVGTTALDFVHEDDVPRAAVELERILTTGEDVHVVLRAKHRTHDHVWVEVSGVNHLETPELHAIVVSMRDVTERIQEQQRMERLLHDAASVAFVVDRDLRVTWTTPGVEQFIGKERHLRVDKVRELLQVDGADPIETFDEVVAGGPGTTRRVVGRLAVGQRHRWVDLTITYAFDDPTIDGVIVKVRDVDEAVRASEAGQRLGQVLGNTTDLVGIYDTEFTMVWANPAATAVFGEPPIPIDELWGRTPHWARTVIEREAMPALRDAGVWRGELAVITTLGEELPIESSMLAHPTGNGAAGFISVISRDISERKALEARLHDKARTDPLTGLPNRAMVTERLGDLLHREGDARVAVAFIDIDQFKSVNDTQGHDAGDQLLMAIADRLRRSVRTSDLVARFGGDEFVVVLSDVEGIDAARARVERVLTGLRGSVRAGSIDVFVTASAGVAMAAGGGATDVISNADAAMYAAKSAGRDQVAVYSDEMRARSVLHLETAHDLRSVLETGGIEVWYQPIVDTADGRPVSMEGLVRWRHPELGVLSPARFVPIAEETGLILPLGEAVIRQACAALGAFGEEASSCTLSVNLSAHQLADPNLPDVLGECIEEHGVPPGRLICEITESAVMQDVTMSAQMLERIRGLGVGIAVDDFGTGYSSLAYLHRFPVDVLKIDREFINHLSPDTDWEHSLAAGIISLAHSLDLVVVAEGVETEQQAQILRHLGCDMLQGYLYARPTPIPEVNDVLRTLHAAAGRR